MKQKSIHRERRPDRVTRALAWVLPCLLACGGSALLADDGGGEPRPVAGQAEGTAPLPSPIPPERIQVTATRVPEDVEALPASVTLIDGDALRARGAVDLAGALALVAGVSIAPGGDAGPAASVPELWGLREIDAFLLVVDGVPWGGAFNPALASLSLEGVERIEVERGPAPVMYGATSFVGVIQVIHAAAGAGTPMARLSGGSYGSGGAAVTIPLVATGRLRQSIGADLLRQGFRDDRTELGRGHLLYRVARESSGGRLHLDFDATFLRQDPQSPRPRVGTALSPLVPLDSNQNPRDARLDEDRLQLAVGYDGRLERGSWALTLALTDTRQRVTRGFLTDLSGASPDAEAFSEDRTFLDGYFDGHLAIRPRPSLRLVAGVDHLYGRLREEGGIFDYSVTLDGRNPQALGDLAPVEEIDLRDRRNFSGLYIQMEWTPTPRFRGEIGGRLNRTEETRGTPDGTPASDTRRVSRGSGIAGVSWLVNSDGDEGVWIFADARSTFKPAAIDLGPDAEPEILAPETAVTCEIGVKGRRPGGRLAWQASAFRADLSNLLLARDVGGLPGLINAGEERLRGVELEANLRLPHDLRLEATYSLHDARFENFVQDFGGVPTQLRGNRLEMSARHLASVGLVRAPLRGWGGSLGANYVGRRYLDQRNSAQADPYIAVEAGVAYRFRRGELRIDGWNLGETRPPVSASEIGDAQYYLLAARRIEISWVRRLP
ncbi:MAG TPA: TonB-dependent receptor [Candidatus Polarisedimenticolia bacterium]